MANSDEQKEVRDLLIKVKQLANSGLNARERTLLDGLAGVSQKDSLNQKTQILMNKIMSALEVINSKRFMDDFDKWFRASEPVLSAAEKAVSDLK